MPGNIIYVMGVSGSGKTTIGKALAERLGIPFFDADDFHPETNVAKMKAGLALTDQDREGWLTEINRAARRESKQSGAVFACSALKEKYREVLAAGLAGVKWIFLCGDFEMISQRMKARTDHYMPQSLLTSQFEILEEPAHAIKIDVTRKPEDIVSELLLRLDLPVQDP